jgi:histone H3/H4
MFCSVSCWDAHVPMMNHKDAWAEERMSPATAQPEDDKEVSTQSQKMEKQKMNNAELDNTATTSSTQATSDSTGETKDVLIVTSKMKNYIKDRSGMNTSGSVSEVLSDRVRSLCDQAIENAKAAGRKTVMDRDFT